MAKNRSACLIRVKSASGTRRHLILRERFTIGRSETADLPLLDLAVSRQHVQLEIRGEQIYLTDLNSSAGVKVAGDRIAPSVAIKIEPTQPVRLGSSPVDYYFICIEAPMETLSADE